MSPRIDGSYPPTDSAPPRRSVGRFLLLSATVLLLGIGLSSCLTWYSAFCAIALGDPEASFNPAQGVCTAQGFGPFTASSAPKSSVFTSGELFWTEDRARVMGTLRGGADVEKIVDAGRLPAGVDIAPASGFVVWTDATTNTIRRAGLDGSGEVVLFEGISESVVDDQGRFGSLTDVAVDEAGGKLYWGNVSEGAIQRANLDGTGLETIVMGLQGPTGIDIDPSGGKLYWTHLADTPAQNKIQRANLDGSQVEDLLSDLPLPQDLAVDPAAGTLYWTDPVDDVIRRADLDGSGVADVVTGLNNPTGLVVDRQNGVLYWGEALQGGIRRANVDGSSIEEVLGFEAAAGLAIDPDDDRLYWANWIDGTLERVDLTSNVSEALIRPGNVGSSVALDEARETMYWLGVGASIQRASIDGTNQSEIVGGELGAIARGLDFDPVGDRLYYAVSVFPDTEIRRVDPDGSNLETVLTGIDDAIGDLAVDSEGGKMYWTDDTFQDRAIRRANLDGSDVETFYTTPGGEGFITGLNAGDGTLVWVLDADIVQRADPAVPGNVVDVVTNTDQSLLSAEAAEGKIFWARDDGNTVTIARGNPDGSGIEDVFSNLPAGDVGDLAFFSAGVIPVELAFFDAVVDETAVSLRWKTLSETNNAGFEVQMQTPPAGTIPAGTIPAGTMPAEEQLGDAATAAPWEPRGFVDGAGTTEESRTYRYRVEDLSPGTYRFRLRQIDTDGTATVGPVATARVVAGMEAVRLETVPNPLRTTGEVRVTLPTAQRVQVEIYDILGRRVRSIYDGPLSAMHQHRFLVNVADLAGGTYFVRVRGTDTVEHRSVTVLR